MIDDKISFDHIHIISEDPRNAAKWYVDILGATIRSEKELRSAPQITVSLGGLTILIRGRRPGEVPSEPVPLQAFEDYSSHNEYGTDHFAFTYHGDLRAYCEALRAKGVTFAIEPWEFRPGHLLCYLAAPDGVSIELVQAQLG